MAASFFIPPDIVRLRLTLDGSLLHRTGAPPRQKPLATENSFALLATYGWVSTPGPGAAAAGRK